MNRSSHRRPLVAVLSMSLDGANHKEAVMFDGDTYEAEHDKERLMSLLIKVRTLMAGGAWWTLHALVARTGGSESSVSARLRDLRKTKFGAYNIVRRRIADGSGLHEYMMDEPSIARVLS